MIAPTEAIRRSAALMSGEKARGPPLGERMTEQLPCLPVRADGLALPAVPKAEAGWTRTFRRRRSSLVKHMAAARIEVGSRSAAVGTLPMAARTKLLAVATRPIATPSQMVSRLA